MGSSAQSLQISRSRDVERLVRGTCTSDGDGVRLTRVLTQQLQRRLDPFLMLDAFGSDAPIDYVGGFPAHPHRGFETVTYMVAGRMRHEDSAGHAGVLGAGSVQWMTAGRGLVHSEMPEQESGLLEGFQLWVNLAAKDKMQPPHYRDVSPDSIPHLTLPNGTVVRVIAGRSHGVVGAIQRPCTDPLYLDIEVPPGADFAATIPRDYNAFLYAYRGAAQVVGAGVDQRSGPVSLPARSMAILTNDADADGVRVEVDAAAPTPAKLLLIAGQPLCEPIVQYGPFVMNTADQIFQALSDFRTGEFFG